MIFNIFITIALTTLIIMGLIALSIYIKKYKYVRTMKQDEIEVVQKSTGKLKVFTSIQTKAQDSLLVNGKHKVYKPKVLITENYYYLTYYTPDPKLPNEAVIKNKLILSTNDYKIEFENTKIDFDDLHKN